MEAFDIGFVKWWVEVSIKETPGVSKIITDEGRAVRIPAPSQEWGQVEGWRVTLKASPRGSDCQAEAFISHSPGKGESRKV